LPTTKLHLMDPIRGCAYQKRSRSWSWSPRHVGWVALWLLYFTYIMK
jgi:hypothetical protein